MYYFSFSLLHITNRQLLIRFLLISECQQHTRRVAGGGNTIKTGNFQYL